PREVVGVIDDAHLVGLGVTHANIDGLRGRRRHQDATAAAASLRALVAAVGSGALKIAEPATTISTPASTARAMFERSMPPSISIGAAALPAGSSIARIVA